MKPGTNTTIGDGNLFMAVSHVAHDCRVGNNIVFASNVMLAGHVQVDDRARLFPAASAYTSSAASARSPWSAA